MRIEAAERDSGVEFGHSLVGNNVDRGFVPSVEKGVRAAEVEGVLAGYQVCDLKVEISFNLIVERTPIQHSSLSKRNTILCISSTV